MTSFKETYEYCEQLIDTAHLNKEGEALVRFKVVRKDKQGHFPNWTTPLAVSGFLLYNTLIHTGRFKND